MQIHTIRISNVHIFQLNLRNSRYSNFLQFLTICTSNVQNFLLNLHNSGYSNFQHFQTIHTSNVHNIPQNLCNFVRSEYSSNLNFVQIRTIRTSNVHIFQLNLHNCGYSNFLQFQRTIHLMYTISCLIYALMFFFRWAFSIFQGVQGLLFP